MQQPTTYSPPPDVLLTGHFIEHHGYAVYRQRGSGNWLMTYTLAGQGLYRQPGIQIEARPGDIVMLQPGALHDYSVPGDSAWEFLWVHFQPRLDWLHWWQFPEVGLGLYKAHLHAKPTQERVHSAFLQLHGDASAIPTLQSRQQPHAEDTATQPASSEPLRMIQQELALNALEEVLLLIVRENRRATQPALDPRVQRVLEILAQQMQDQHSLETLAAEVALSPSRLAHLFKQEVGNSPMTMLLHLRLNKAARLLEVTSSSISMVAEAVGFRSAFYFSRQFHQHFGTSPKDYRAAFVG
ncbi:MAG TPA: helix-turn-helix domain-containing protein [Ktedonobacteraceae bacterium]|nr:helix-turn-helix domain-containing protein [Ktedonobacteraceae bacterium]